VKLLKPSNNLLTSTPAASLWAQGTVTDIQHITVNPASSIVPIFGGNYFSMPKTPGNFFAIMTCDFNGLFASGANLAVGSIDVHPVPFFTNGSASFQFLSGGYACAGIAFSYTPTPTNLYHDILVTLPQDNTGDPTLQQVNLFIFRREPGMVAADDPMLAAMFSRYPRLRALAAPVMATPGAGTLLSRTIVSVYADGEGGTYSTQVPDLQGSAASSTAPMKREEPPSRPESYERILRSGGRNAEPAADPNRHHSSTPTYWRPP
jgi:hypothetical protein